MKYVIKFLAQNSEYTGAEDEGVAKPRDNTSYVLSVYGYTNYRSYLKDYYQFRKDSERGYSYRSFSKSCGFSSPNVMKLVIDGARNIGADSIDQFIKGLHLTPPMAAYFKALVTWNHAKHDEDSKRAYDALMKLTPIAKRRELQPDSVEYLSHWLNPTIREMVQVNNFSDNPYWIARRIHGKISVTNVAKSLKFLLDNHFIEKTAAGYKALDNAVISSDEVRSLAIRQYHRNILEQAQDSLQELDVHEREFSALTFVIPEQAIDELKFKLKEFRKALHHWSLHLAADSDKDTVVQVNFQMYPVTKKASQ